MAVTNGLHANSTGVNVHTPISFTYADQTEREGDTLAPEDVGKFAWQQDDDSIWMLTDDSPLTWAQISATGNAIYPQDCMIFIHQFKIASGVSGGFTKNIDTAQQFNTQYFQASPADGDKIQTTILLKAGTYDVYVLGVTANNRGKLDWAIDGGAAFISGQDWYNGSTQQNIIKTGTCTIGADGRHILSATVNTKNASSSNYFMVITAVWFVGQSQSSET